MQDKKFSRSSLAIEDVLFALVFISEALDLPVWLVDPDFGEVEALDLPVWLVDPDFGEVIDQEDWVFTLLDTVVQYILHVLGVISSPILRV